MTEPRVDGWRPHKRVITALMTVFTSLVMLLGASAYYTTWAIQRSQHQWCDSLRLSLQPVPTPPKPPTDPRIPPASEFGRQLDDYNKQLVIYNSQRAALAAERLAKLRTLADHWHCALKP
jgi:hypothetical protein